MELLRKNIKTHQIAARGNFEAGVETDIIVPDIKPDIVKILQSDAFVLVSEKEVSDGQVYVSGRVFFTILYTPDRDDEKIKSIDYSCDFKTEIRESSALSGMEAFIFPDIEKTDCQVINSRKIRVKASVSLFYEICDQASYDITYGIQNSDNCEVCVSPFSVNSLFHIKESEFLVRENFEISPGQTAIDELLKTDIKISDIDYKCATEKVVTKGCLNINYMYTDTLANIKCCDFELPFTEIFDIPDADDNTSCEMDFFVKNFEIMPMEDSDGDMRIISLSAQIGCIIKASKKEDTELLIDCFIPGEKTVINRHNQPIEQTHSGGVFQTTMREIITPDLGLPSIFAIYNVSAKPEITKTLVEENNVFCEGILLCRILYLSESEESPVCCINKKIPFSYTINTPGSQKNASCTIDAKVIHTGYSLNPAGEAEIRAIISLSANVLDTVTLELIDDIEVNPMEEKNKNTITIYFTQENDTLWDISKKYSVSQKDILFINNLDDSIPITSGMKLLIPNSRA